MQNRRILSREPQLLYNESPLKAVEYLNTYSNEKAQQMLARWKQLAVYLIVKYNDMAVKPDVKGRFTRTETGLGATVLRPGIPENTAREIVRTTDDKYAVPEEK